MFLTFLSLLSAAGYCGAPRSMPRINLGQTFDAFHNPSSWMVGWRARSDLLRHSLKGIKENYDLEGLKLASHINTCTDVVVIYTPVLRYV